MMMLGLYMHVYNGSINTFLNVIDVLSSRPSVCDFFQHNVWWYIYIYIYIYILDRTRKRRPHYIVDW